MHVVVLGDFNYKEVSLDVDVTEDHTSTSHSFVEAIMDSIPNQHIYILYTFPNLAAAKYT